MKKAGPPAPNAPTLASKTHNSVTLTVSSSGYEYSADGGKWQKNALFIGLTPGKTYTFYQRVAETKDAYASAASVGRPISTAKYVSVEETERVVPAVKPDGNAAVIAPTIRLAGEFTAGPNPVAKQSGIVNFYRQGKRVANCELRIYDASGNVISKVKIRDKALSSQARRQVGSWDLKDSKGRQVSEGTYLVRGTVKTSDGNREKISLILGVRQYGRGGSFWE
jgi:hypothetical protein